MRTDVKVRRLGEVRLPNIPLVGSRKSHAVAGDFLQFKCGGHDSFGRVIGFVNPPEERDKTYIVVLMLSVSGHCWERWVLPDDVIDCGPASNLHIFSRKLAWYFSEEFQRTPVDVCRNAFDLTANEILASLGDQEPLDAKAAVDA